MLRLIPLLLLVATVGVAHAAEPDPVQIVAAAQVGLERVMSDPETAIPSSVFADAHGLLIWPENPSVQFIAGGKFQHCVLITRKSAGGEWNPPQFMNYRLGSLGAQAGYTRTTVVRVYLTRSKLDSLQKTGVFLFGLGGYLRRENHADPLGSLQMNADPDATVLTYSSGSGITGGVVVQAHYAKMDQKLEDAYYSQTEALPETARDFLTALNAFDVAAKTRLADEQLASEPSASRPSVTRRPAVTQATAIQPTGGRPYQWQPTRLPVMATDDPSP